MPDALNTTRQFLQTFCADDPDELANRLEMQALLNAAPLVEGLLALETLLAQPLADDTLRELVTHARIPLAPPTDETARAWLTALTAHLRRELQENLLPYQPLRAHLIPIPTEAPRFPCDLHLYPTPLPTPKSWQAVWEKDKHLFYAAFLREWDRKTCPTCQTPTIRGQGETKYTHEVEVTRYNTAIFYDKFNVYRCTQCHLGWTEKVGELRHAEIDYP